MSVFHGLAGRPSIIHADVVPIDGNLKQEHFPHFADQRPHFSLVFSAKLVDAHHVPARNHESMAFGYREGILECDGDFRPGNDFGLMKTAEWTEVHRLALNNTEVR